MVVWPTSLVSAFYKSVVWPLLLNPVPYTRETCVFNIILNIIIIVRWSTDRRTLFFPNSCAFLASLASAWHTSSVDPMSRCVAASWHICVCEKKKYTWGNNTSTNWSTTVSVQEYTIIYCCLKFIPPFKPWGCERYNLNFPWPEVMYIYRDTQLQVTEIFSNLWNSNPANISVQMIKT